MKSLTLHEKRKKENGEGKMGGSKRGIEVTVGEEKWLKGRGIKGRE